MNRALFLFAATLIPTLVPAQSVLTPLGTWELGEFILLSDRLWGYEAGGKQYALVAQSSPSGVKAVDITDPANPIERGFVPGPFSNRQDVTGFGKFAYKVSQQGTAGLQIIDSESLAAGKDSALLGSMEMNGYRVAHTLHVDAGISPARLHAAYGGAQGVAIYSLANPAAPSELGIIPGQANQVVSRSGRLFVATQRQGTVEIWDVADAGAPDRIGVVDLRAESRRLGEIGPESNTTVGDIQVSGDGAILFTTESVSGASIKAFDVRNPAAPVFLGRHLDSAGRSHRIFLDGANLLRTSAYGLEVLDASNPAALRRIALYSDSSPGPRGVYAGFSSGAILYLTPEAMRVFRLEGSNSLQPGASAARLAPARLRGRALHFDLPGSGAYSLSLLDFRGRQVFAHQGAGQGSQVLNLEAVLGGGRYLLRLNQDGREFSGLAGAFPRRR